MSISKNYNTIQIILLSILGALLVGALWRYRGSHGWGGEVGVMNVGFLFTLFLVMITGDNAKATPLKIIVTAIAFIITTPEWGTINGQINGLISNKDDPVIYGVSKPSAIIMMLILGFGMAGMYAVLMGNIFSPSSWKIRQYVTLIVLFFGVMYLCKATVSHSLVKLIQPVSESSFREALAADGITGNLRKICLEHFFNDGKWAKAYTGGRNYIAEINNISKAIATVVVLLADRFLFADKVGSRIALITCLAFGVGITVADLFFYFFGGVNGNVSAFVPAWSSWEFFTGFIAGGIITFAVLKLGVTNGLKELTIDFLPPKFREIFAYLLGYGFAIGFMILYPVIKRFDDSKLQIPVIIVSCIAVVGLLIFIGVRNKFDMSGVSNAKFAILTFTGIFIIQTIVYFFCAKDYAEYKEVLTLPNVSVIVAAVPTIIFAIQNCVKAKSSI